MQYFSLAPNETNVPSITRMAEEGFESTQLVLVQANGLEIADSEATRGKLNLNLYIYLFNIYS